MARSSYAAIDTLGIAVEDLGASLDMMAKAGNLGSFELRDMAQYFPQLTAQAKLLGMEGSRGLASLASAAQIAVKGAGSTSEAANNLANFLAKLSAPVTVKAFEKFGVNLNEEVKKGIDTGDLVGYMAERILQITGGDAAKISMLFSDMQAKNFIAPMVQNIEEYRRIRDEVLSGAGGTVDTQFQTAMSGTSARMEALQIQASATLQQSSALDTILAKLNGIAAWANEHPELASWLAMGAAAVAAGGLVIGGAATAIGAIVTSVGALTSALTTLGAFLIANPVVLPILGLAAVGVAAFKFGEFLNEQINLAVKAVTGDKFATLGTAIYDMVQWFKALPGRIKAALGNFMADMKKVGVQIIDGLIAGMKERARAFVDSVKQTGKDAYDGIKDFFGIKSPSRLMAEVGENIGLGMAQGIEASIPTVQAAAEQLAEVIPVTVANQPRNADGSFKSRADAAAQGTGILGGLNEYAAGIQSLMNKTKDVVVNAFKGMEDALTEFVVSGKLDFKSLVDSMLADIARIAIQQSITSPMAGFFASIFGSAKGNAFANAPALSAYSGQIVSKPTLFPFATGGVPNLGLMGEAGPEVILPLRRGAGGVMGVEAAGNVQVNVINNASGTQATATERMEGGTRIIDVMVEQVSASLAGRVTRGGNPLSTALERTYGLNRAPGAF
jgi:hypothetical protein